LIPQRTLHAAVEQGYRGPAAAWPDQFAAGSRKPPSARTDAVRPRLSLLRAQAAERVHVRWPPSRTLTAPSTAPS
jgi:anthraniloyl-CoA monooxygenase